MLFDMPHTVSLRRINMDLLSDPYAPRTEKQIPFYQGFILVMRHGPYLTLTAAFLFITVAIQVNTRMQKKINCNKKKVENRRKKNLAAQFAVALDVD